MRYDPSSSEIRHPVLSKHILIPAASIFNACIAAIQKVMGSSTQSQHSISRGFEGDLLKKRQQLNLISLQARTHETSHCFPDLRLRVWNNGGH
jgi:hypothetical protein